MKLGNNDINDLRIGGVAINRVALGNNFLWDRDASAYIAAIEAAGATVSSGQAGAINDFVIHNKNTSAWSTLRRIYFPVWAVAAANAICMKSLSVATWVGSVAHEAGYVQSDGTTGEATTTNNFVSDGLLPSSAHLFMLGKTENTTTSVPFGAGSTISNSSYMWFQTTAMNLRWSGNASNVTAPTSRIGVLTALRFGGVRSLYRRDSVGSSLLNAITNADESTVATDNVTLLSIAGAFKHNGQVGATGWGVGLSSSDAEDFSGRIKTLWETVTGLALP